MTAGRRTQADRAFGMRRRTLPTINVRPVSIDEFREHLTRFPRASFQQTPEWAEVRRGQWQSELLGWFDGEGGNLGVAVVRYRSLPGIGMRFAYIPYGPLFDWQGIDLSGMLSALRGYLAARRVFAVRIIPPLSSRTWSAGRVRSARADPNLLRLSEVEPDTTDPAAMRAAGIMREGGWRKLPEGDSFDGIQNRFTHRLSLDGRTEAEILAGMSQSWRRHIKLSAREGGEVRQAVHPDLEQIHLLHVETAQRQGFSALTRESFDAVWDQFGAERSGRFRVDLGCHEGDTLSAYTVIRIGTVAHMVFASNSLRNPRLHLSNAVIWAQIRQAISDGAREYNLGGVTDVLDDEHPQAGLLRFKIGLGGEVVEGFGPWDLAIRPTMYSAFMVFYPLYSSALPAFIARIRSRGRIMRARTRGHDQHRSDVE